MASFEEQMAELEKVVEQLEQGDLPLEENVTLFERGVQLSDACKSAACQRRKPHPGAVGPDRRTVQLRAGGSGS